MLTNLSPVITIFELAPLLHSLSLSLSPSLLPQTHYHLLEAILGFCSCVYQRPDGFIYPPLNLNLTQADVREQSFIIIIENHLHTSHRPFIPRYGWSSHSQEEIPYEHATQHGNSLRPTYNVILFC